MGHTELGSEADWLLDRVSERVGPAGRVIGVERSPDAVELARGLVADRGLGNVEVVRGDARSTGLPEDGHDLVTARLVLVTSHTRKRSSPRRSASHDRAGRSRSTKPTPSRTCATRRTPPGLAWRTCSTSTRSSTASTGTWAVGYHLRGRLLTGGLVMRDELDELQDAPRQHLAKPDTVVASHLFVQAGGRKPG